MCMHTCDILFEIYFNITKSFCQLHLKIQDINFIDLFMKKKHINKSRTMQPINLYRAGNKFCQKTLIIYIKMYIYYTKAKSKYFLYGYNRIIRRTREHHLFIRPFLAENNIVMARLQNYKCKCVYLSVLGMTASVRKRCEY